MVDQSSEAPRNRMPPDSSPGRDYAREEQSFRSADGRSADSSPWGTAADLFAPLMAHLHEFLEYVSYYASARADLVKAQVRKVAFYGLVGVVAALAGATALVAAVVMTLVGIAGGLGELMGHRLWAGYLTTGLAIVVITFGALRLMLPQWIVQSRNQTKEKYDRRRQTQRAHYGHDVDEVRKN